MGEVQASEAEFRQRAVDLIDAGRRLYAWGMVPANTTHWFDMGEHPDFQCIRFFTTPDGWEGDFTGSDIAQRFPTLDEYLAGRA